MTDLPKPICLIRHTISQPDRLDRLLQNNINHESAKFQGEFWQRKALVVKTRPIISFHGGHLMILTRIQRGPGERGEAGMTHVPELSVAQKRLI